MNDPKGWKYNSLKKQNLYKNDISNWTKAKFAKEERETLFLTLIRDTRKNLEKKKDLEIKKEVYLDS